MGFKKWATLGAVGLAIVAGTYSSHKGDIPPLYVNKVGTSGGVAVGIGINIEKNAKFYGVVTGGAVINNSGQINGISLGIMNSASSSGEMNGLEIAVANSPTRYNKGEVLKKVNGMQISFANLAKTLKGVQIGFYNEAKSLNGVQIGLYNKDKNKQSIFFNYDFGE